MNQRVTLLALDISELLGSYQAMPGMNPLYRSYAISDMITDLLKGPPSPGDTDIFYDKIAYVTPIDEDLDMLLLEDFLNGLFGDLDMLILSYCGKSYELDSYHLKGWLSPTTVVLELHGYAKTNNRPIQFDFSF